MNFLKRSFWSTDRLVRAAVIAALYCALTLVLAPLSFGPVQLRVSEALTLLPILFAEAVPGLFIGCFLSNLLGAYGLIDAVVGSLATLIAAMMTYRLRGNKWLAALPPVLVNAVVIGVMLFAVADAPFAPTMLYIGVGQAAACYALGIPLLPLVERLRNQLFHQKH